MQKSKVPNLVNGSIYFFEPAEGWGYIKTVDGEVIFFHVSACRGQILSSLSVGKKVQFQVSTYGKIKQATHVYKPKTSATTSKSRSIGKVKDVSL